MTAAKAAANAGNLKDFVLSGELAANEDATYGLVIWWEPSDADNNWNVNNGKTTDDGKELHIDLGVHLVATQKTAENDSWDETYDKDAWAPDMVVTTAAELVTAIKNVKDGGVIALTENLTFDKDTATSSGGSWYEGLYYVGDKSFTIDLNGKTITNDSAVNDYLMLFKNDGDKANTITIKNGTLEAASSAYCAICTSTTSTQKITINLENVNVIGNNSNGAVAKIRGGAELNVKAGTVITGKNNYIGIEAAGKNTVVNIYDGAEIYQKGTSSYCGSLVGVSGGATANVYGGSGVSAKGCFIAMTSGGTINVSGGEWIANNDGTYANGNASVLIAQSDKATYNGGNSVINVTGGTFMGGYNCYGNAAGDAQINISAGTFNADPSTYVAADYKAVEVDGTYYVVADNVAGIVTKPETLKDALTAAGAAGAGNTTIAFFGSIDMTGIAWTPIKVDGYNGADIVTIEGNGATITGLTAPLFAGGFAGGSGIVIKDLTIADSNIVSTNTIGSGAFIESVDSMALITLDNCHLVNSTVTGGSGSRTGGLIGWTAGYNNVNDGPVKTYVNITNCSVIDCTITCDGSVGGIYGHAGNNAWTYSTIANCTVKNCKLNSTDDGGWRVGVVVGTANVGEVTISNITESGNTMTQTGKTAPAGQSNLYGRFVPGTTGKLVIDGALLVADSAALTAAVQSGVTDLYLAPGEYNVAGCTDKTLTISGSKNAVLKLYNEGEDGADYGFKGSNVTFNGITIDTTADTGNYKGYAYMTATFNNCNFFGAYTSFKSNTFNNCTFDFNNGYFWTWGAEELTFNGCTFNGNSKTILAHGGASTVINIKDCSFKATEKGYTGAGDNTAVVEIDPIGTNTYTVNFTGNNTKTDSYAGWTRVKDGSTGHVINGVN